MSEIDRSVRKIKTLPDWPQYWSTEYARFRNLDTGALEVLENGSWTYVPSNAAREIRRLLDLTNE